MRSALRGVVCSGEGRSKGPPLWKVEEVVMKGTEEGSRLISRRNVITGTATLLAGGVLGRISRAFGAPTPAVDKAPPLPWKWVKLDPMEAGRRAYRAYLKEGG